MVHKPQMIGGSPENDRLEAGQFGTGMEHADEGHAKHGGIVLSTAKFMKGRMDEVLNNTPLEADVRQLPNRCEFAEGMKRLDFDFDDESRECTVTLSRMDHGGQVDSKRLQYNTTVTLDGKNYASVKRMAAETMGKHKNRTELLFRELSFKDTPYSGLRPEKVAKALVGLAGSHAVKTM